VGTIKEILGKELFEFIFSPAVFFNLLFLGRAIFFTALEIIWPARKLSYLPAIWRDFVAYVFFRCVVLPIAIYLNSIVIDYDLVPAVRS